MRHLKTTLAVLGAATVLVLAGNTLSWAATGKPFLLGKSNAAGAVTTLSRTTSGPVLSLKSKSSAGVPLVVNGKGKVTNLNADKLDGLDSTALRPRTYVWTRAVSEAQSSTHFELTLAGLPVGAYNVGYSVFPIGSGSGDTITCYLGLVDGGSAFQYVGENRSVAANLLQPSVSGSGILVVSGVRKIQLGCDASFAFTTSSLQPIQVYANPITVVSSSTNARMLPGASRTKG